jgi:hypothetical protein
VGLKDKSTLVMGSIIALASTVELKVDHPEQRASELTPFKIQFDEDVEGGSRCSATWNCWSYPAFHQ